METDKTSRQKQNESARQSKKDIGHHRTEAQRNTCDDAEKLEAQKQEATKKESNTKTEKKYEANG